MVKCFSCFIFSGLAQHWVNKDYLNGLASTLNSSSVDDDQQNNKG